MFMNENKIVVYVSVVFIVSLICCGSISSDRTSEGPDAYPDSLFRYHSIKYVADDSIGRSYDKGKRKFILKTLNASDRKLLTNPILGRESLYNAYYYSKQKKIRDLLPILVLADADDYRSVILFVLSDKSEVKNYIELTQSKGDVIDQRDGREIVGVHERYSEFLNDSTVRVTDLKGVIDGYGNEDAVTTTDSVTVDYRITHKGIINQIRKDSIRNIK